MAGLPLPCPFLPVRGLSPFWEEPGWDQSTLQHPGGQALTNFSQEGKAGNSGGVGKMHVLEY